MSEGNDSKRIKLTEDNVAFYEAQFMPFYEAQFMLEYASRPDPV